MRRHGLIRTFRLSRGERFTRSKRNTRANLSKICMRYRVLGKTDVGLGKTTDVKTWFQPAPIPRLGQGGVDATPRRCREATELERTGRFYERGCQETMRPRRRAIT